MFSFLIDSVLVSVIVFLGFILIVIMIQLRKNEKALELANQKLLESSGAKCQFMRQMTHELRAPLAAIQNYLQVALDGYMGTFSDSQLHMLQTMHGRAENLLIEINEVLDFATLQTFSPSHLEKKRFLIQPLLEKQIDLMQGELMKHQITLSIKPMANPLFIFADEEKMKIVLMNLISNAIKYTPDLGNIELAVQDNAQNSVICISDTGIGIALADMNSIFNEFYRTPAAIAKEKMGTGLGLSIAKNIVELHQGKLTVESEEGKGSTFCILLPKSI